LNVTKTVLSWIHEFENKRIVELQREFRVLFGLKGVAGREHQFAQAESAIVRQEKVPQQAARDTGAGKGVK